MTLETIYFASSIAAALGVIGSLIFVGVQLRQGHRIARADSQRDLLKTISDFNKLTFDNAEVLDDVRRGLMEYDSAPHSVKANFATWAWFFLHTMEQCVYMKKDGLITDSSFNGFETGALGIISTPGGAQWWAHSKKIIGVDVSSHLDERLAELGGVAPPFYELLTQFEPIEEHSEA